jgi:hypothetical protein
MAADPLMIAVTENRLVEYQKVLLEIYEKLDHAATLSTDANTLIADGIYKGKAYDELQAFFYYLEMHIKKIELLYGVGAAYIQNTYDTFTEADELTGLKLNQIIGQ